MNTAMKNSAQAIRLIASPALESFVQDALNEVPEAHVDFQPVEVDQDQSIVSPEEPAMETMQMHAHAATREVEQLQKKLLRQLSGELEPIETGQLQLFLLDGKGIASGAAASQATLRAMVQSALSNPENTVVAFLPKEGKSDVALPDELPEAVQNVTQHFLDEMQVRSLESHNDLINFLREHAR